MTVTIPERLDDLLDVLDERPDTQLLAGGTDFMVEVNFGHRRPTDICALRRVPELRAMHREHDELVLGSTVTYRQMEQANGGIDVPALAPALAQAARTVGSPQIRNAGTIGGNLGTASPAGDTLPVLAALDATVVVASRAGPRELNTADFLIGPKRNALRPGEVVAHVRVPVVRGPQEFLKVGARNAMVIAVCSLALVVDLDQRQIRCALGSVGPTVLRAQEAEQRAAAEIDWATGRLGDPAFATEFGRLVADAAQPIDDHRSTADYRRHAIAILAERALRRST